jgi:hypothetical protein
MASTYQKSNKHALDYISRVKDLHTAIINCDRGSAKFENMIEIISKMNEIILSSISYSETNYEATIFLESIDVLLTFIETFLIGMEVTKSSFSFFSAGDEIRTGCLPEKFLFFFFRKMALSGLCDIFYHCLPAQQSIIPCTTYMTGPLARTLSNIVTVQKTVNTKLPCFDNEEGNALKIINESTR